MRSIEVFYYSRRGASIGRVFCDENTLVAFISKLRKPARIFSAGEHIGNVWKDGARWNWLYSKFPDSSEEGG